MNLCVCVWMEKVKADGAAQWPHFTKSTFAYFQPEIHTSLMHRQERQLVLESFFPSQTQNLKSPISADWQLWFPLGWPSSGGKLDQDWRVREKRRICPLASQTSHLPRTMLSAWCYCADQKWESRATGRVWCSDIICEPLCVVWQQSQLVLLRLESWTQVNPISQWVRTGG